MSEAVGRGMLSASNDPPSGAELAAKPVLTAGTRYVFRRGGQLRSAWTLTRSKDALTLVEDEGLHMQVDDRLALLGEFDPDDATSKSVLAPADSQFAWPLWPGKTWVCEFVRKTADGSALPIVVRYDCDVVEDVRVPAGKFRCWRIWRTSKPAIPGRRFLDSTSVSWYSPEVGYFVRRLVDGVLLELESVTRPKPK